MDTIGLDLHKRESQLCIMAEDGTMTERRIVTSRERFTAVLGDRAPARLLLEASTESEWVARHWESLGHTVIVADPNYAPVRMRRSQTERGEKAHTPKSNCADEVVSRRRTQPYISSRPPPPSRRTIAAKATSQDSDAPPAPD